MEPGRASIEGYDAALGLLRDLRRIDESAGVRNSRIAFDVAMLFFEATARQPSATLTVDRICAATGYSGPTVRLVLKRLLAASVVQPTARLGKTQLYAMTESGYRGFEAYVAAVLAFRGA